MDKHPQARRCVPRFVIIVDEQQFDEMFLQNVKSVGCFLQLQAASQVERLFASDPFGPYEDVGQQFGQR